MPDTLAIDEEDSIDLLRELEATFAIRITDAEAEACRTAGDLHTLLCSRFHGPGAGACMTAMAFYRLRRVFPARGDARRLRPGSGIDNSARVHGRRLLADLARCSGLRMPGARMGRAGLADVAIVPVALLLACLVPHAWQPAPLAAAVLGLILAVADRGRLTSGCETLGDLANAVATLNFGRLAAEGGRAGGNDLWRALLDILPRWSTRPDLAIHPATHLLPIQPRRG